MSVDSSGARLSSEQRSQCDDVFPDGLPGETSHSHGNEQDINVMSETDETDELLNTQALLHTGWGELLKTNTRESSSIRRHAQSGFEQAAVEISQLRSMHDEESESTQKERKLKAWFYPSLFWGLPPQSTHTRRDGAVALQIWDVVVALACLYQGFMVPFSLCFEKLYLSGDTSESTSQQCLFSRDVAIHPDAPFLTTRYLDVAVDALFIADILLNFVSARWVLEVEPMEHWRIYDNVSDIARLYLKGHFAIDVAGSLPVQYIDCVPGLSVGRIKLVRLLRLIKLVRLNRLKELIVALQTKFPDSVYLTTALQLLITFSLFAHISACLFFYMAYGMADPKGDEYERYLYFNGWVYKDGMLNDDGDLVQHSPGPWISSFYWAVTTMSTIGYGDISPGTAPERILGMVLMAGGCSFFAWVTGTITQLLTRKPACVERFDTVIGDLESWMNSRRVPVDLRQKIRSYFQVKYPSKRVFDEAELITSIESPFLRKDIVTHLFHDLVATVPLFQLVDEDVRKEICFKLRSIYRMPGRVVTTAGTVPESFYFIRFGTMSLKGMGMKPRLITQGDIFGEMALLGLTPNGLRLRTCTAISVVELCEMQWDDFQDLLISQKLLLTKLREVTYLHVHSLRFSLGQAQKFDPRSGRPCNDFYDALSYVEWREICSMIAANSRADEIRDKDSKFDQKLIKSVEEAGGRKMMQTSVSIFVHSIKCAGQIAEHRDGKGIVLCSWAGVAGLPVFAVQNETKAFDLISRPSTELEADIVSVRETVVLAVAHPNDMVLSKLPPITIRVLTIPTDKTQVRNGANFLSRKTNSDSFSNSVASISSLARQHRVCKDDASTHFGTNTAVIGMQSKIVKNALPIFQGKIDFAEWTHRQRSKDAFTEKDAPQHRPVLLSSMVAESANITTTIDVSVSFSRKAHSEAWGMILPRVETTGASDFFVNKLQRIVQSVERRGDAFVESLRPLRIAAIMKKAHESRHKTLATNVEKKRGMAVDANERGSTLPRQNMSDKAEDSTSRGMEDGVEQGAGGRQDNLSALIRQLVSDMRDMKEAISDVRAAQTEQEKALRSLHSEASAASSNAGALPGQAF